MYSLFLFIFIPIMVKINQFYLFQINTKFNIFYKNYTNIFFKLDIFINCVLKFNYKLLNLIIN